MERKINLNEIGITLPEAMNNKIISYGKNNRNTGRNINKMTQLQALIAQASLQPFVNYDNTNSNNCNNNNKNNNICNNYLLHESNNQSDFLKDMGRFKHSIKSLPTTPGVKEILLPGEPERNMEAERRKHGIPVDDGTWGILNEIAEKYNTSIPAALN